MRILNLVSSNVVQDPRIQKQMETIKSITDDYIILGKLNENVTDSRLESLNFNFKLFGKKNKENNIISKLLNRIRFGFNVIKYIKKYQPNIIHDNDFDMLFITFLSRYKKAKIIYDAHEIYAKNAFINKFTIISFIVQQIEKYIVKRIDGFITVSHAASSYYKSKGYAKEAIVITNAPIKEEGIIQNTVKDHFDIVYQGQLVENRGYEEFLKSGKLIKNSEINLIIRGFGNLKEKLQSDKEELKIENVRIEEPVEMNQLVKALSKSDVGVILTKPTSINFEYTVSNKIFECIHAGLPVILSPVKEHKYLNDIYNFGIVLDEVTSENIAEAIFNLYKNPETYNELKNNAIKASEVLTWQNESKKLIELYKGK
ncbi:glycosyltransferase [Staphylococcus gallinarum]|uniref:glycosyltransferase n=1 Tax=Staphylococcus gallinarum TaxID=1293 RepID=UPI001E61F0F6|nr:glycosyltransferase [Staphylococcus gallinarum]MCD8843899.1 glycosyltransferase [Staphylococcus gallinarum]